MCPSTWTCSHSFCLVQRLSESANISRTHCRSRWEGIPAEQTDHSRTSPGEVGSVVSQQSLLLSETCLRQSYNSISSRGRRGWGQDRQSVRRAAEGGKKNTWNAEWKNIKKKGREKRKVFMIILYLGRENINRRNMNDCTYTAAVPPSHPFYLHIYRCNQNKPFCTLLSSIPTMILGLKRPHLFSFLFSFSGLRASSSVNQSKNKKKTCVSSLAYFARL